MTSNDEQHRKQCLRRHYENMDKSRALLLSGSLGIGAKKIFIKRVNFAKGYRFI